MMSSFLRPCWKDGSEAHFFSLFVLVDGGEKATEDGGEGDKEKSGGGGDPFEAASADAPANNGDNNGASNNAEQSAGANNR